MSRAFPDPLHDHVRFATILLDDISAERHPVWPTTIRHARAIAKGLAALSRTRGPEVMRAVAAAPRSTTIDWPAILAGALPMTPHAA